MTLNQGVSVENTYTDVSMSSGKIIVKETPKFQGKRETMQAEILREIKEGDIIEIYTLVADYKGASGGGYYSPSVYVKIWREGELAFNERASMSVVARNLNDLKLENYNE